MTGQQCAMEDGRGILCNRACTRAWERYQIARLDGLPVDAAEPCVGQTTCNRRSSELTTPEQLTDADSIWRPNVDRVGEFMTIDLGSAKNIKGLVTQVCNQ